MVRALRRLPLGRPHAVPVQALGAAQRTEPLPQLRRAEQQARAGEAGDPLAVFHLIEPADTQPVQPLEVHVDVELSDGDSLPE